MDDVAVEYLADYPDFSRGIAEWQQAEFGYLNPAGTLEQRAERLREAQNRDRLPMALVAVDQNRRLLGSAAINATTLTHRHLSPWLSSVFVPPEARGRGIASELSLRASDEAARLGHDTLYLFTPRSERLYARIGWTTFDTVMHNGVQLTIMSRRTDAPRGG